jgi:hypothetical protein
MRLTAVERAAIRKITRAGGRKRIASLSPAERTRLATKAVITRWANYRAAQAAQTEKEANHGVH